VRDPDNRVEPGLHVDAADHAAKRFLVTPATAAIALCVRPLASTAALNRSRQPTHGTYCTVVPRFKRPAIDRGSLGSRHTHGGGAFLYHFISHGSGDRGIGFQGFFTYL